MDEKAKEDVLARERERDFHNARFSVESGYRKETSFYRALHSLDIEFSDAVFGLCKNSDALEFGCGDGSRAIRLDMARTARSITAIDISDEAIKLASSKVNNSSHALTFLVDNCESTSFPDSSFDVIFGSGIIHHLSTERSSRELHRLLRPGGAIVFYEPLGTNPLIQLYRRLTPRSRSADEHPLLPGDIRIIRDHFPSLELSYFGLFTIAALPFYRNPRQSSIYRIASACDRIVLRWLGPMKWLAWAVLLQAHK